MARRDLRPMTSSADDERAALFAGVKAEPDDDTPRLVLADWLEENGDEDDRVHAELIRVQCEIVRLCAEIIDPGRSGPIHALLRDVGYHNDILTYNFSVITESDERIIALRRREKELLGRWQEDGRRIPILPPRRLAYWSRGLASLYLKDVPFKSRDMAALAAGRFGPRVDQMALGVSPSNAAQIARSEMLAHLSGLEVGGMKFAAPELWALLASPHLAGLRRLDPGLHASLALVRAMLVAPQRGRLTHLYLYSTRLEAGGFGELAAAALPALTTLALSGNGQMGTAGAEALSSAPFLGGLHYLSLINNRIGPGGIEALAAGTRFRCPVSLKIGSNGLGVAGLRALLGAPGLEGLAVLGLDDNGLDDEAIAELAASPRLGGLVSLALGGNAAIGPVGVEALACSPYLARLASLSLVACPIGEAGIRALLGSPHLRRLQLRITMREFSDKTLADLRERYFVSD